MIFGSGVEMFGLPMSNLSAGSFGRYLMSVEVLVWRLYDIS